MSLGVFNQHKLLFAIQTALWHTLWGPKKMANDDAKSNYFVWLGSINWIFAQNANAKRFREQLAKHYYLVDNFQLHWIRLAQLHLLLDQRSKERDGAFRQQKKKNPTQWIFRGEFAKLIFHSLNCPGIWIYLAWCIYFYLKSPEFGTLFLQRGAKVQQK